MKKPPLTAIVFVCGASTMALELTGSRIVAPYVGTSIYVWLPGQPVVYPQLRGAADTMERSAPRPSVISVDSQSTRAR